jgi:hypothetical protein
MEAPASEMNVAFFHALERRLIETRLQFGPAKQANAVDV